MKAVLFDMDGVLYDSMPNHATGWTEAMKKYGIKMSALDAYLSEGMRGVETIRKMVLQQQGKTISEEDALAMYNEKARIFALQPAPPMMPGALELMEKIKDSGMHIGVVTGSAQRPLIERLISDYGHYLSEERIVTAFDVKRGKPAPDPYLKGAEKAGVLPQEAIVVENAPLGVAAAVAAGCFTIAVNTGILPDEALAAKSPNLLFHSLQSIADNWEQILKM